MEYNKKHIPVFLFAAFTLISVSAQPADSIGIGDISVQTDEETLFVSFRAAIDPKAATAGTTLVYAPVITDGQYKVSLPAIVVEGRRAKRIRTRRRWPVAGEIQENAVRIGNGSIYGYSNAVPFQPWMREAGIDIETLTASCGSLIRGHYNLISSVLPRTEEVQVEAAVPVTVEQPVLTGYLAETLPFVLPEDDFDPDEPVKLYDDERDNALTVYYRINSSDIEEDYADNRQTLTNLLAAINLIRESDQADVNRVVVAGFASPDGSFEFNDYLAWQRAEAIESYILRNTALPAEKVFLFNGSADWRGLRLAILEDENVPSRTQALGIIDSYPLWDEHARTGRQTMLRGLAEGATYRYLAEHIFPKLRNGAFIRVYFEENKIP